MQDWTVQLLFSPPENYHSLESLRHQHSPLIQYWVFWVSSGISQALTDHHRCVPQPVAPMPDSWMQATFATETEYTLLPQMPSSSGMQPYWFTLHQWKGSRRNIHFCRMCRAPQLVGSFLTNEKAYDVDIHFCHTCQPSLWPQTYTAKQNCSTHRHVFMTFRRNVLTY